MSEMSSGIVITSLTCDSVKIINKKYDNKKHITKNILVGNYVILL